MLKRVHIRNFKSLGDVTVDLGPVAVLIGRSGTGKTNFVEALRFLRDTLIAHDPTGALRGDWQRVYCATPAKPGDVLCEVSFSVPGIQGDYEYHFRYDRQQHPNALLFQLAEEKLVLGGKLLFHQQGGRWVSPPAVLNPPPPGGLRLGTITGVQNIIVAYIALTDGLGCYDFPGTVLTNPQPQTPGSQTRGLADDGSNFLQVFGALLGNLSALANWRDITAALQKINSSVTALDLRLPQRDILQVGHDVGSGTLVFNLSQESEGFRRFLAHLLALYQAPPKQTLVFEEPEKGIHPGALAALAEEFIACPEANRGQVVLTTHSPQLLDHFSPDMLRVVERKGLLTAIGPVAPEQLEALKEELLQPGELLTVDPARLPDTLTPIG
jgi:AAA domain, putative AbiEii toxin, Type IV TA system/AAA ATPase domain